MLSPEKIKEIRDEAKRQFENQAIDVEKLSKSEIERLIQETQVNKIELQMQNEELRKMQSTLENSRDKFLNLYNSIPIGYIIIDELGFLIQVNNSFLEMMQFTKDNLRNRTLSSCVHLEDRNIFLSRFKSFFHNPVGKKIEVRMERDDKSFFYARIEGRQNEFIGEKEGKSLLVIIHDITLQVNTEVELKNAILDAEKANRLKSSFLANMSHEIRTPMNAIIGYTDLLLQDIQDSEHSQKLQIIKNSGNLLLSIINDILDISKIESGTFEIHKEAMSLENFMNSCFNNAKILLKTYSKSIELEIQVDESISKFFLGDNIRLTQIMNNFISNAIKFTETGKITIGVEKENDTLKFFVKDTGIGIDDTRKSDIFNPFYQIETGFTKSYRGSGLGLAITQNIVQLMNGRVYVQDNKESTTGSIFSFTIPWQKAEAPVADNANFTYIQEKLVSKRILIVDDDEVNLTLLKALIAKSGYSYLEAMNGLSAFHNFRDHFNDIGLILMDIQMPIMNGIDATKEIRKFEIEFKFKNKIPIIAFTAASMPEDIKICLDAGFSEHFPKPIEYGRLLAMIEKFLHS